MLDLLRPRVNVVLDLAFDPMVRLLYTEVDPRVLELVVDKLNPSGGSHLPFHGRGCSLVFEHLIHEVVVTLHSLFVVEVLLLNRRELPLFLLPFTLHEALLTKVHVVVERGRIPSPHILGLVVLLFFLLHHGIVL